MPKVIKETLGIDVQFVRIHRNGIRPQYNNRPVTITAKLVDGKKKEDILNAQKLKKIEKKTLPFFITPQQPPSINSAKNKLYDKADSLRKQNINARVQGNRLMMPNGAAYVEEIPLISSADALQISPEETDSLDEVFTECTDPVQKHGSEFVAIGTKIKTIDDAHNLYKKVSIDPYAASTDSKIFVYRLRGEHGKITENYHDDREHGAGRRLLRYFHDNQIYDVAVVVTRWMPLGDSHMGPVRFSIMEELVNDVVNKLDDR